VAKQIGHHPMRLDRLARDSIMRATKVFFGDTISSIECIWNSLKLSRLGVNEKLTFVQISFAGSFVFLCDISHGPAWA